MEKYVIVYLIENLYFMNSIYILLKSNKSRNEKIIAKYSGQHDIIFNQFFIIMNFLISHWNERNKQFYNKKYLIVFKKYKRL